MLFIESYFGGMKSKQEAISVKINTPVDQKYFIIPKNIKFKEAPDLDDIDKMIEKESEEKYFNFSC